MKRLLIQTQLSNINYIHNKWDLACDSGWQMCIGRVREMLKLNHDLYIDIMGPLREQLLARPEDVNLDMWEKHGSKEDDWDGDGRLNYIEHKVVQNALVTRYDFDWKGISFALNLPNVKYDAVYINDPMHLRNFKAMFHVVCGYQPKFYVHAHFVDVPEVPKFPAEASLWLGQCEAALKADYNFWQCESAMNQFFDSMGKWFTQDVVDDVRAKSSPWDDGYSSTEITSGANTANVRFDYKIMQKWRAEHKKIVFFPNRISPSSGDYTNGMRWMFELLPQLRQKRQDFVVVCGNPNQKFSNKKLEEKCGANGYVSLTPDTFNRDEFKVVAEQSDIVVGLYDKDAYGGTAARECIELGCMPLWLDVNEYASIAREVGGYPYVAKADWSNLVKTFCHLLNYCDNPPGNVESQWETKLKRVVQARCSYEATTPDAMKRMGLL